MNNGPLDEKTIKDAIEIMRKNNVPPPYSVNETWLVTDNEGNYLPQDKWIPIVRQIR